MQPLVTPFLENLFIVNHKRKHKFLSVAKVGSTTLKTLTAHDDKYENINIKTSQDVHGTFGYKDNGKTMISVDSGLYPKYKRVAPYRDPVERVTSWYKDKILGFGNDQNLSGYCLRLDLIMETDYKRILDFLRFEVSKPHAQWIDEHLRPFSKYISEDQVDTIVRIEDLDKYLESIGCDPTIVKSKQKNSTKRIEFEFPWNVQRKIRKIYKDDIKFIKRSSKVYSPE